MQQVRSIQYGRAVAALAVIAYHAGQWVLSPVAVGAAGVDIFFVISGFVMWTTTSLQPIGPLAFLWRRLTRVGPLYWLLTLALAAAALAMPGVFPHVTPQIRHIALSMLFIPHRNPENAFFPLLAPGWTLSYEALFYLVFAVGLMLRPAQRWPWLVAAMAVLSVTGLIYAPAYTCIANPMLLQFVGGAALGRLWLNNTLPSPRAGVALIVVAVAALGITQALGVVPESLLRPLAWGAPAFALVLGGLAIERGGSLPRWPALGRLGDASYAIYLCHHPLMALWNRVIGPTNPILFFVVAVGLAILAGLACHQWIERPLLALVRRPRNAPAVQAGAPSRSSIPG